MKNAKKNPAGTGEVSEEGKTNSKSNGKVIPFRAKAGKFRKQEQRKKGVRGETEVCKKIFQQIEIPFPVTYGIDGKAGEFTWCGGRCKESAACGIGLGPCESKNG